MSHEIETMAFKGETPWHGLGHKVDGELSVAEMLKAAKIDWTVSLRKLQALNEDGSTIDVGDFKAVTRDSDGKILDVVGSRWMPTQNADAFEFFNDFVHAGDAVLDTAGSLRNGKMVWCLANLKESFKLAGGDEVRGNLLFANPHEQGKARIIKFTPVRVVCWNTLSYALNRAGGEWRQSHRAVFDKSMHETAKITLGIAREQFDEFKETATKLSKTTLTHNDSVALLTSVVEPELWAEVEQNVGRVIEMQGKNELPKRLELTLSALDNSPGAQLKSAKGTLWGVCNSVSYAVDHAFGRGQDQRLFKAWFGNGATLKANIVTEALKLAA